MSYTFFFYNSHSLEIKDLQPWTKCSHNSDDIQHMAIFSGTSDASHILGHAVAFQFRDFLYTPLLSCGIDDTLNQHFCHMEKTIWKHMACTMVMLAELSIEES